MNLTVIVHPRNPEQDATLGGGDPLQHRGKHEEI
jgi:hypothetical protein